MNKPDFDLIKVSYRIKRRQKAKLEMLAKAEHESESGIVRNLIDGRKLRVRSEGGDTIIKLK